jgi:hypothetical protein
MIPHDPPNPVPVLQKESGEGTLKTLVMEKRTRPRDRYANISVAALWRMPPQVDFT